MVSIYPSLSFHIPSYAQIALRLFWQTSVYNFLRRVPFGGLLGSAVYVFALSVFTAFMETFTIQSVSLLLL